MLDDPCLNARHDIHDASQITRNGEGACTEVLVVCCGEWALTCNRSIEKEKDKDKRQGVMAGGTKRENYLYDEQ